MRTVPVGALAGGIAGVGAETPGGAGAFAGRGTPLTERASNAGSAMQMASTAHKGTFVHRSRRSIALNVLKGNFRKYYRSIK